MANTNILFDPIVVGDVQLDHRIVLAPLTRMRADQQTAAPTDLMVEYYTQRATKGGLLITEATIISPETFGDYGIPGIFSDEQVAGWKRVVDSVHSKGGVMSCQLWHQGRVAHESFAKHPLCTPTHSPCVGPSNVPIKGKTGSTFTRERLPYSTPRALRLDEIPRLVNDYRSAAECAKRAGFDFVEIHAAHGYLINQFLHDTSNKRTDQYGGSFENRSRLLHEVIAAVNEVFPLNRMGVRISPISETTMKYYGTGDSNPDGLYKYVIQSLDKYGLGYLLLTEPRWFMKYDSDVNKDPGFNMKVANPEKYRSLYKGLMIGAGGFTPSTAADSIQSNHYQLIGFGRFFISNPDIVDRIRNGKPFNIYNRRLFYAHGKEGYTDYPVWADVTPSTATIEQAKIGASLKQSAKL